MKNSVLDTYQLRKKELIMLWLKNYDFGQLLVTIKDRVKFQSIDMFIQSLVLSKKSGLVEDFSFLFNLL